MKTSKTLAIAAVAAATFSEPLSAMTLTEPAKDAILRALDDEYHAEAVYGATIAKFGNIRPFSNIILAEQSHQKALIDLMQIYGMDVPSNGYLTGDKPLPPLPETLREVCVIGVAAEIENSRLYEEDLLPAVADHPDITRVFKALSDASIEKHLPAFQRCADRGGAMGGQGHGQGHGNGAGKNKGNG